MIFDIESELKEIRFSEIQIRWALPHISVRVEGEEQQCTRPRAGSGTAQQRPNHNKAQFPAKGQGDKVQVFNFDCKPGLD